MNKADLTEEAETLIYLLGEESAIKFVEMFGSKRITLSTGNKAWKTCLNIFGEEKTTKLQTYIGPVYYYVPKNLLKAVRNLKVIHDKDLGLSIDKICTKYNLSRRMIMYILQ